MHYGVLVKIGIVGAGLFGTILAIEISKQGNHVDLFEAKRDIHLGATSVNQARLHTGMHYPRSKETGEQSFRDYRPFINRFRDAIREIDQHYAISSRKSKTTPSDFIAHAERLGLKYSEVPVRKFLNSEVADILLKVPEATFDFRIMKELLKKEIGECANLRLHLSTSVNLISENVGVKVETSRGTFEYDKVIVATYAQNNELCKGIDVELPSYIKQLCEVAIVTIPKLQNVGLTIMDGPFWSTMPFGMSNFHTLTNVVLTPHFESETNLLNCQKEHGLCGKNFLFECNKCKFKPKTNFDKMKKIFEDDTDGRFPMTYVESLFTVKSIPQETEQDSAKRPTEIYYSKSGNVAAVFSGKIASAIHQSEEVLRKFN